MKYKHIILLVFLICICIIGGVKYFSYYAPAKERPIYQTIQHHDDTIRIAYIGDSWAFGHQFHQCKIKDILENKLRRSVIISSYGIGGLTRKEIYHALFELDSFRHFIEKGYDFCFISAGINDTNKKMSTSYYQENMNCIIQFMLSNYIHPIILEIPDFNIYKIYENENIYNKTVRNLSMLINGTSIDCKQDYRNALDRLIQEKGYQDKVSVVRYKSWNMEYENDLNELYIEDQLHLNDKGYELLDSVIAKEIYCTNH